MWEIWKQAKTYSQLPSFVYDPTGEVWQPDGMHGPLARWMFNSAVTWFGVTIENLLQERIEVKTGLTTKSHPKYTLIRLLHPMFRLTKPDSEDENWNPWSPLLAWAGKRNSGVKRYAYQEPLVH